MIKILHDVQFALAGKNPMPIQRDSLTMRAVSLECKCLADISIFEADDTFLDYSRNTQVNIMEKRIATSLTQSIKKEKKKE